MSKIIKILIIIAITPIMIFALSTDDINTTKSQNREEVIIKELNNIFKHKRSPLLKNIKNRSILKRIYKKNHYRPLWIQKGAINQTKAYTLLQEISEDRTLSKNAYLSAHNQELAKEVDGNHTKEQLIRLELKLTAHYYDFLRHYLYGEIAWKQFQAKLSSLKRYKINASWVKYRPKFDLTHLILDDNIAEILYRLKPKNFGYEKLLLALEKLEKQKEKDGGWKKLPYFKRLKIGSSGNIVKQLKERLKYSNDYKECQEETPLVQTNNNLSNEHNESNDSTSNIQIEKNALFDNCLDKAVKKFQKRHGLEIDGIVGVGTRKALNLPIDDKIKTILLNIDRIKWLPREQYQRYLIVNIPEFMLYYIENERTLKELRVITGDTKHPTPIFSEKLSYIVLNPYWKVPNGIVKREIIPGIINDPNYLKRHGLKVYSTWSERSPQVDVSGLFWEEYLNNDKKFPYRIMQPPGKRNALGKIKFKFPNRFAVYLHDTPTRYLFKRTRRAFSHGCVRLSNPVSLLETIATFNSDINMTKARKRLKGKRKQQLNIANKLPINMIYLTAGVNENDELEFREDIYHYDKYMKRVIR